MERNLDHVDLEFRDFVKIDEGDSGFPQDYDSRHPMPSFCEATDDLDKFFQVGDDDQKLQKLNRSRMETNRNPKPESKPAETTSCEEFFDCNVEKRASSSGKIRLFKRLIAENNEVAIEGFNADGTCCYTRFVSVDAIDEGSPLAKASVTDSMNKTLTQLRAALLPEEFEAAQKAVAALDVDLFLQICRRAQVTP
jgi:hypothetical protein